jgi:hypothetical protein
MMWRIFFLQIGTKLNLPQKWGHPKKSLIFFISKLLPNGVNAANDRFIKFVELRFPPDKY